LSSLLRGPFLQGCLVRRLETVRLVLRKAHSSNPAPANRYYPLFSDLSIRGIYLVCWLIFFGARGPFERRSYPAGSRTHRGVASSAFADPSPFWIFPSSSFLMLGHASEDLAFRFLSGKASERFVDVWVNRSVVFFVSFFLLPQALVASFGLMKRLSLSTGTATAASSGFSACSSSFAFVCVFFQEAVFLRSIIYRFRQGSGLFFSPF